jgi:tetratricopeptide (TPR) repeat protein
MDRPAFRSLRRPTLPSAQEAQLTGSLTTAAASTYSGFYNSTELVFIHGTTGEDGCGGKLAQLDCCVGDLPQLLGREGPTTAAADAAANKICRIVVADGPRGLTEQVKFAPKSHLFRLANDLQLALVVRLLLRLLSQPGDDSPEWLWQACAKIVRGVVLRDPRYRAELLEVSCLRVEHGLANGTSALIEQGQLGEALEACGRFEEAAGLYAEAALGERATRGGAAHEQAAICHTNAGVAYRRGGQLLEAEKQYGLAMRCYFDASPDGCTGQVSQVLDCLNNALKPQQSKPDSLATLRNVDGSVAFEESTHAACIAGQALLARAGDENYQTALQLDYAKNLLTKKARKDANRAIVEVARAGPEPADVREALLQCLRRDIRATWAIRPDGGDEEVNITDGLQQVSLREDTKAAQRQLLQPDSTKPATAIVGKSVRIDGLKTRADCNGATGTVLSYLEERDRFAVEIGGTGERMALKRENLVLLSWENLTRA